MDRGDLSEGSIHEMGVLVEAALRAVAAELSADDLAGLERRLQAVGRTVLGPVVERVLAGRTAREGGERLPCPHCGGAMRRVDQARERHIQGVVGAYTIWRPYDYDLCDVCRRGQARAGALRRAHRAWSGGALADPAARGVPPGHRSVLRGGHGRGTGDVGGDGRRRNGAAGYGRDRRGGRGRSAGRHGRRAAGAAARGDGTDRHRGAGRGGGWRAGPPAGGLARHPRDEGGDRRAAGAGAAGRRRDRAHVSGLGHGELWRGRRGGRGLLVAGLRRGLPAWRGDAGGAHRGPARRWRGVDPAARHALSRRPWRRTGRDRGHLPRLRVPLGRGQHRLRGRECAGRRRAAGWVQPLKGRLYLYEQGAAPVLAALSTLTPETEEAAEAVRGAAGYFTTHAARLDYPRFVARRFPIGSGAVESTCKVLIAARAKGAGMRWSGSGVGLQAIASLRAVQRAGRWGTFWQTQPQRRSPYLQARPRPRLRLASDSMATAPPQAPPPPVVHPPAVATPPGASPAIPPPPRPAPLRHQRPFLPPRARSA